jgi:hypothetical protein
MHRVTEVHDRILDRRPVCQILIGRRDDARGDNDSTRGRRENEQSSIHFSSLIECTRVMQMTAAWRSCCRSDRVRVAGRR